ncbi:MAG TPA: sorbosone dehydrogenase family protein [Bryobacteraceae bacterium]|jgi:glucose/arabinose dehydrogenase|nr:sorbosone dehydrogenase family protein [Bryobacteraceae bacterium]
MNKLRWMIISGLVFAAAAWVMQAAGEKLDSKNLLSGQAGFMDYRSLRPGTFRKITAADLPKPFATSSSSNAPTVAARPADAWPQAPAGFKVELYATGLDMPRQIRLAPNGDFFVAESQLGEVKVFRGRNKDGKPEQVSSFAAGLKRPFGVAFYPLGSSPQWVYVGNTDSVVRFPYRSGDLKAGGSAEVIVPSLPPGGGHWTRDVVFSLDGQRMFVAVGSGSNVDDPDTHPAELHRANILEYTPEGKFVGVYASGIRNPVGLGVNPQTGELWCSVNERDALGDNLVPDYVTHVQQGGFYGWPWYYIGSHQDPRHQGKHPELKDKVLVPDVLLQPHNASLGLTFYDGTQFPSEYRGDLFAAEHGSWNRSTRTGYEVIRVPLDGGHASGAFEDFLTGFVTADGKVWGRPVGVAVAKDGALFVTDDGSRSIWRVSYGGK